MRILVVEDDPELRNMIARQLSAMGDSVETTECRGSSVTAAVAEDFDVLVIGRRYPDFDGLSLLRRLRAEKCATPALILSAMATVEDRIEGFDAGADAYLPKPFGFAELSARLHALHRRRTPLQPETHRLVVGDIELDFDRQAVLHAGRRVDLGRPEFALLAELMRNAGAIVTRAMLVERVWHRGYAPRTNILNVHLSNLRARLRAGLEIDPIETIHGEGYRMRAWEDQASAQRRKRL